MSQLFLITGCSGGGKSTLLNELSRRRQATVDEPGRRIVAEELASGGSALPWIDLAAFARRAVAMSREDLSSASNLGRPVFFDRGLIDAAVALELTTGTSVWETIGACRPYADPVFLAPPWPDLFATDRERRHSFSDALDEFERLNAALTNLQYTTLQLPKASVQERADFVLQAVMDDG